MKYENREDCFAAVVEELGRLKNCLLYKKGKMLDPDFNRYQKIPYYPEIHETLPAGLPTDNCSDFLTAMQNLEASDGVYEGLGIIVNSEDPYCFIDIDNCFDPETREIAPWAMHLVEMFDSFTHVTPSGNGLRIVVRGSLEKDWSNAKWVIGGDTHKLELKYHKAFQTFPHQSKDVYRCVDIAERQDSLDKLVASFVNGMISSDSSSKGSPRQKPSLSDLLDDTCPVKLSAHEKNVWAGIATKKKDDGKVDRSESLYWIACVLKEKGASVTAIASALKERDRTLGWHKYAGNDEEYTRIVEKVQTKHQVEQQQTSLMGTRTLLGDFIRGDVSEPEFVVDNIVPVGKTVHVFAPSGKGKSWLALWLAKEALGKGNKVLYFDQETGPKDIANRLRLLGLSDTETDLLFDYRPDAKTSLTEKNLKDFESILDVVTPAIIIFDSWAAFLSSGGLDENDSMAIAKWSSSYLRVAKNRGIATVILDHTVKNGGTDMARGSGRKKEEVDAQFELQSKAFDSVSMGEIKIISRKDRDSILPKNIVFKVGGKTDGSFILELKSVDAAGKQKSEKKTRFHDLTPKEQAAIEVLQAFGPSGARKNKWISAAEEVASKSTINRLTDKFQRGELAKNVLAFNEDASAYSASTRPHTNNCRASSRYIGAFDKVTNIEDYLVS